MSLRTLWSSGNICSCMFKERQLSKSDVFSSWLPGTVNSSFVHRGVRPNSVYQVLAFLNVFRLILVYIEVGTVLPWRIRKNAGLDWRAQRELKRCCLHCFWYLLSRWSEFAFFEYSCPCFFRTITKCTENSFYPVPNCLWSRPSRVTRISERSKLAVESVSA